MSDHAPCPDCGASASPGSTVCMQCGSRLNQHPTPEPMPAETVPVRRSEQNRGSDDEPTGQPFATVDPALANRTRPGAALGRWARPALVLGAVVAAGVLAASLVLGQEQEPSRADSSAPTEGSPSAAEPSSQDVGSDASAGGQREVTCWNGSVAESDACPALDDTRDAFGFVFPSVDVEQCSRSSPLGRTMLSCTAPGVRMNLSKWDTPDGLRANYDGNFGAPPVPMPAGRVLWDGVGAVFGANEYKSAAAYQALPWSITVYGSSEEQVSEAVFKFWMRPAGELRRSGLS